MAVINGSTDSAVQLGKKTEGRTVFLFRGFFHLAGAVSLFLSLIYASANVWAQTDKEKRKTTIDFEDELVEGELKKPELFYLLQKKQFNFKRLIKLREDFLPEMRRDADEVRKSRSK